MANREIEQISEAELKAMTEKKKSWNNFLVVAIVSVLIVIICFVLFLWKQVGPIDTSMPINSELLGTLGEFVGGILGTFIAIFSIYMLVKTFHAQMDSNANMKITNDNVIDTNESQIALTKQQLFDNKFQVFFDQYKDAVASYESKDKKGRPALEDLVTDFVAESFTNSLVYKKRSVAAVRVFEEFYALNRRVCSVHFRELYLLSRLLAEAKIKDDDRSPYVKCLRGQLSDGELIILRYNCLTDNGAAMRRYVNTFNLLKHLSIMSLFEFRQWAKLVPDKHERSALDAMFIMLRKAMKDANEARSNSGELNDNESTPLELSSRYLITLTFTDRHTRMIFRLEENKKHKGAAGVRRPFVEKALDRISPSQKLELFYSYLHEAFITSNFGLFGNPQNCVHAPIVVENNADSFIFEIEVKGPNRLVLSMDQMSPVKS